MTVSALKDFNKQIFLKKSVLGTIQENTQPLSWNTIYSSFTDKDSIPEMAGLEAFHMSPSSKQNTLSLGYP